MKMRPLSQEDALLRFSSRSKPAFTRFYLVLELEVKLFVADTLR